MQGKLFQKCTHLLYCSVLSLGGNVNTRRMLQPDMGSIFHIKKSTKYSGHRKLLCELSNLMLLTSSDTKRTLMHLFLFTNSAQRELVSICTQSCTTAINFPCITPLKFFSKCGASNLFQIYMHWMKKLIFENNLVDFSIQKIYAPLHHKNVI